MATVKELLVKLTGDSSSLRKAMNVAKNATDRARKAIDRVTTSMRKHISSLFALAPAVSALAVAYAALKAINIADEFTLLKARIDGATESVEESTIAWEGLKDISKDTGADLGAAVDVFQRLSFVRTEIGATIDDMLQFTETVSQLGIVSGASTGALRAGLTQLGQGLSSGVLRAEEFNSILENIPAVGKAIAEEFGVTTGQLRNLVIDGKVLSEDVFQAILNQSEKVRAEFEKFPTTVGRAFANLKIRLSEAIDGINEATGATGGLIKVMEIAGKTITTIANLIKGFANIFSGLFDLIVGGILTTINTALKAVTGLINLGIKGINLFKDEKIEPIDLTLGVANEDIMKTAFENASGAFTKAAEAFENADFIVGGLFGDDFNDKIDKTASKVKELSQDYSTMGSVSAEAAKKAEKAMKKLEEQTIKNRTEMADFIFDSMKGFDSLRDVALKALDDIARSIVRTALGGQAGGGFFEQIGASIFGGFGGLFGGGTGGDITASGVGGATSGFLTGFANGGSFKVGGDGATDSGIVAFKATRGEEVSVSKPNQTTTGGGVSIVQNITIGTSVTGAVRQEIAKMVPDLKRATIQGVEDARMRGIIS